MSVIAIDPGSEESALVVFDGQKVVNAIYQPNDFVLDRLQFWEIDTAKGCKGPILVIEMIASYGMPVGAEVFETCVWIGRFMQAYGPSRVDRMPRLTVKQHLCHDSRAKDANIRQALIDRFGGKDKAIGNKKAPGPLFGITGDLWAALALGITYWDRHHFEALRAAK